MKSDLTGTVSLVTGAARGIGKAIADRLAANGSTVYYTDRDADAVRAAAGAGGRSFRLDVNSADDITIANRVTIDQFPRDEWDRILAVDLTGVYEVSRAFSRLMRRQRGGRIINIASIAGLVPLRLQCAF